MISRLLAFLPHAHRWRIMHITRCGAQFPGGRQGMCTAVLAQCTGCGIRLHKVFYRDISDAQARRWLG
ncbi:hypothetical protein [Pantoea sp.]|uniref:hypothetical protein n=1 Tax=Pantoea sp. TaxID=69393 RepID=UPI0031DB7F56